MNWREYISTIRVVPTRKGLNLSTSFILQLFAAGWTAEQILQNYPQLRPDRSICGRCSLMPPSI